MTDEKKHEGVYRREVVPFEVERRGTRVQEEPVTVVV